MQSIVVSNEILLERLTINDADTIYNAVDTNRIHLGKWLPFVDTTQDISSTVAYIQLVTSRRDETGNEVYTIWYKGNFAGIIGFHYTDKVNEKTEIGYWLIRDMTGKGIITISCRLLVELAFETMGMNRITIRCAVGNTASEKIASRLGFSFEGIERNGERYRDRFFDINVYSLLKHEYSSLL